MGDRISEQEQRRMTRLQWQAEKRDIIRKLQTLTMFGSIDTTKEERIRRSADDLIYFAQTYLPHYFYTKTQADWHEEYCEEMNVPERPNCFMAPRSNAKSTLGSFADIVHDFCFDLQAFIVLMMETQQKATYQTERIALELRHNPLIQHDFGDLLPKIVPSGDFTMNMMPGHKYATRLVAVGAGQSVRGFVHGQYRPTKFIIDDYESNEAAHNPKRVDKAEDLVYTDYIPSMCAEGWVFRITGTKICKDSLLDRIENRTDNIFFVRKYRQDYRDKKGVFRSTWEELHPAEKLLLKRQLLGPHRYEAEFNNDPQDNEGAFKDEWFRHWSVLPPKFEINKLVIALDPSYSDTGDNKAFFLMGNYNHTTENRVEYLWKDDKGRPFDDGEYTIIVDAFNRQTSLDDLWVALYAVYNRWKPQVIQIDGTYAQKKIIQRELGAYEAKHGRLPIKYRDQTENKTEKIMALQSPIMRGYHVFPSRGSKDVDVTIRQFTRFGKSGIKKDGPDAIAEGTELLRRLRRKSRSSFA